MLALQRQPIRGGFIDLPAGTYVLVSGPFTQRALVLTARVGDVPVLGVQVAPTGGSFMGRLSARPPDGAVLYVSYPPEPEVRTTVVYRRPAASSLPVA